MPDESFDAFFDRATKQAPYPYQRAFATADGWPHLLRAPTGAGKTAAAVLGWLYRWHHKVPGTPRRLVYCLPMRVLVEQSAAAAKGWIGNLGLAGAVDVHQLMGGVEAEEWFLRPERPAVLIGTQDMLLSRALNRGYAASRFHWPVDFGLLNGDCLWVYDEPQLMAAGVATSAQLAGLRVSLGAVGDCPSVWMSATLEPAWLDTVDFREHNANGLPLELTDADYQDERLAKRMNAAKTLRPLGVTLTKDGDAGELTQVAKQVLVKHHPETQTLVVMNTVKRAKAVYAALAKELKKGGPKLLLVHSRFRPHERQRLNESVQDKGASKGRIIVATQVVEAGVDISARVLVTELAPWASVVQRLGRCNRTGDDGPGEAYWVDNTSEKPAPYEKPDLDFARTHLMALDGKGVSPAELDRYKRDHEKEGEPFLRFEHTHVLRRRDLVDLFDTAPDLSGNDIDVARYVRGDDPETDVQVFWRPAPPDPKWKAAERRRQEPRREELCNVPIGDFKAFLAADKTAYRFDALDKKWQPVRKKDANTVIPGQVFWVTADQGGYDAELGWEATAGTLAPGLVLDPPTPDDKRRDDTAYDTDDFSHFKWRSIADHTGDVVEALGEILAGLTLDDRSHDVLDVAARWHDWGKAHPVFQSGIRDEVRVKTQPDSEKRPEGWVGLRNVAKAPDRFWQAYRRELPTGRPKAKRFRHELASALGVLALAYENKLPPDWAALTADERTLALFLIASHHGKVRVSVRAMPDESPEPPDPGTLYASGVWDGDPLPGVDLGGDVRAEGVKLRLAPMLLGDAAGWSAGVLGLRDAAGVGPFRLAYLEAILRAADCRASQAAEGKK